MLCELHSIAMITMRSKTGLHNESDTVEWHYSIIISDVGYLFSVYGTEWSRSADDFCFRFDFVIWCLQLINNLQATHKYCTAVTAYKWRECKNLIHI